MDLSQRRAAFRAAKSLGCSLADMDLYRLTLEYPPEPALVVMMAPFPDRPA